MRSRTPRASRRSALGSGAACQSSLEQAGGLGRRVEQQAGQLDGCDAVDHAVVRLADEPDLLALGVLADPHLPQRAVAAQRHRHHLVGKLVERAGCRLLRRISA
jgi:hypothetical protein